MKYQAASWISLQVSNFIMVPVSKNVELDTKNRSPQGPKTKLDSDDDMSLRFPSLGTIPPWMNNSDLSLLDNTTYNLDKEIDNAIPSQGSFLIIENALARPIPVDAAKVQYKILEPSIAANALCSLLVPKTMEQAIEMEF
jgi:hypothetical protein